MHVTKNSHVATASLGPGEAKRIWGTENLSLRMLHEQKDVSHNQELVEVLGAMLDILGVTEAYAPSVSTSSAQIVRAGVDMESEIVFTTCGGYEKKVLWRNNELPADGVVLPVGQAFVMSSAGCPVLIATGGEHMIVAHAGRDSLIDRSFVRSGSRSRPHLSVVTATVEMFRQYNIFPEDIHFHVMYAIPSELFQHNFNHPIYGNDNQMLLRYLKGRWPEAIHGEDEDGFCIDLGVLITEQGRDIGVSGTLVTESISEHPELAHTRDGKGMQRRNLIAVKHMKK